MRVHMETRPLLFGAGQLGQGVGERGRRVGGEGVERVRRVEQRVHEDGGGVHVGQGGGGGVAQRVPEEGFAGLRGLAVAVGDGVGIADAADGVVGHGGWGRGGGLGKGPWDRLLHGDVKEVGGLAGGISREGY